MTARTPTYLKARFENNDIPQGTDYEDVFDSYLNIAAATSSEQTIYGPLKVMGQITATNVSAQNFSFTSVQATDASFTNLTAVSANITRAIGTDLVYTNAAITSANVTNLNTTTVSASSINVATVTADTTYTRTSLFIGAADVSAVGSTQAQAPVLTNPLTFVIYANLGDVGVKLGTSVRGQVQTVVNATTTVIRIFPAVSARFLVTAVNTSLNIPADRVATIYHKGDDRYGIQIG